MRKIKDKFDYDPKGDYIRLKAKGTLDLVPEELKDNYNLTDEEIDLLGKIEIFKESEFLPVKENGHRTGERVSAPPISVALYDLYYGAKRILEAKPFLDMLNSYSTGIGNYVC